MQETTFIKANPPVATAAASAVDPSTNRRTPRRSYERLVGVLFRGSYSVQRAFQIGEGGMMLELPSDLKAGDLIVITLIFPKTLETLVGRAEVLYHREKTSDVLVKMGVKFLNLEAVKRRAIRDFVSAKPAHDSKADRTQMKKIMPEVARANIKKAS